MKYLAMHRLEEGAAEYGDAMFLKKTHNALLSDIMEEAADLMNYGLMLGAKAYLLRRRLAEELQQNERTLKTREETRDL